MLSEHVATKSRLQPDSKLAIWACEELGVDVAASDAELRQAFYRKLSGSDGFEGEALREAVAAVRLQKSEAHAEHEYLEQFQVYEDRDVRLAIDGFAEQFWSLPCAERRRRWAELADRTRADCPNRPFLNHLGKRLEFEPHSTALSEAGKRLHDKLLAMFCMRPAARAAARHELLLEAVKDKGLLVAAAQIANRAPNTAAFEMPMLRAIEKCSFHVASKGGEIRKLFKNQKKKSVATERQSRPFWSSSGLAAAGILILFRLIASVGGPGRSNQQLPDIERTIFRPQQDHPRVFDTDLSEPKDRVEIERAFRANVEEAHRRLLEQKRMRDLARLPQSQVGPTADGAAVPSEEKVRTNIERIFEDAGKIVSGPSDRKQRSSDRPSVTAMASDESKPAPKAEVNAEAKSPTAPRLSAESSKNFLEALEAAGKEMAKSAKAPTANDKSKTDKDVKR